MYRVRWSYLLVSFYRSDIRHTILQIVWDNWFVFSRVMMPFFDADTNMLFLAGKVKITFVFSFFHREDSLYNCNETFKLYITERKSTKVRKYSHQCRKYETEDSCSCLFSLRVNSPVMICVHFPTSIPMPILILKTALRRLQWMSMGCQRDQC